MLDVIVPLKVFIDVNSKQLARFNTFYFITTDCDVRIILVKVMYYGHLRVERIITLVLSLLKARVLSLDQTLSLLIDW